MDERVRGIGLVEQPLGDILRSEVAVGLMYPADVSSPRCDRWRAAGSVARKEIGTLYLTWAIHIEPSQGRVAKRQPPDKAALAAPNARRA